MYEYSDLFDMRSNVGPRLEALMKELEYTKAGLCKAAGISRPTLDKILDGSITSPVNYEKHLRKILEHLQYTPDMLMGNGQPLRRNRIHAMRNALRSKAEDISNATGISAERLNAIECGAEATLAELRDLAALLRTGTRNILGETFFEDQIAVPNDLLAQDKDQIGKGCGFWGHVGIQPVGSDVYFWFPITANTYHQIYRQMQQAKFVVIPCMNNKLLYVNLENIKQFLLLDEACDAPGFTNWDHKISCGEIPAVFYEALDDYFEYDDEALPPKDVMSDKFYATMKDIAEKEGWNEDSIYEMQNIIVRYRDGSITQTDIDFDRSDSLLSEIELVYSFDDYESTERILFFEDWKGCIVSTNPGEISFIELPYDQTDKALFENQEEYAES